MKNKKKILAILALVIALVGVICGKARQDCPIRFSNGVTTQVIADAVEAEAEGGEYNVYSNFAGVLGFMIIASIMMLCKYKNKWLGIPLGFVVFGLLNFNGFESFVNVAGYVILAVAVARLLEHIYQKNLTSKPVIVTYAYLTAFFGTMMGIVGNQITEEMSSYMEIQIAFGLPVALMAVWVVILMAYLTAGEEDRYVNIPGMIGVALTAVGGLMYSIAIALCSNADKVIAVSEEGSTQGVYGVLLFVSFGISMCGVLLAPLVTLRSKKDQRADLAAEQAAQAEIPASQQPHTNLQ